MPKQITDSSSKNADLRKKQLVKLAELNAREDFEREWAMQDLTNPEKVGLSTKHANLVSDKLRESYINKEILSQLDDIDDNKIDINDEDTDVSDDFSNDYNEDEEEDSVEDDNEFSDEENFKEQDKINKPLRKKSPVKKINVEESPAEKLDMGDLENELDQLEEPDIDIPSEEDEEATMNDTLVPNDSDILPIPEIQEVEDEVSPLIEENNEDIINLESDQDEIILELPDGNKLSLKLLEDLTQKGLPQTPREETIMAARNNSVQDRKAQRRNVIANIISEASQQAEIETIKPGSQPGSHKNLGNDTSSQGKPYVMEDATRGVANPGLKSEKMTLKNSDGNSLLSNPNFTPNSVPTVNPDMIANNPDVYDIQKFDSAGNGLFTQIMNGTENKIPTNGDKDTMWGDKGMQQGFELPSQLDSTQQRRTNILAGKIVECAGCYNEEHIPLSIVQCDTCGYQ